MNLLVMQFFPLDRNILFTVLFSNTFSLCSSLTVINQVLHPYITTRKIIILYILNFTFFDRREDKGFEMNGSKQYPNSICSNCGGISLMNSYKLYPKILSNRITKVKKLS
jgi:ABC-type glucose/galactose transport system permease subunit